MLMRPFCKFRVYIVEEPKENKMVCKAPKNKDNWRVIHD